MPRNSLLTSFTVFFSLLVLTGSAWAGTKIKVVEGDLSLMSPGQSIGLVFDYSNMTVGKRSEADYVAEKVAEKNEKEEGKGEEWKAAWEGNRESRFHPKFVALLSKGLGKRDMAVSLGSEGVDIIATVEVTRTEPGFYSYVVNQPSYVDFVVTFAAASAPDVVLAQVTVKNAEGESPMGPSPDSASRIQESYAKGAKDLAKVMAKKIK